MRRWEKKDNADDVSFHTFGNEDNGGEKMIMISAEIKSAMPSKR